MNYRAFTNDSLTMMYEGIRHAGLTSSTGRPFTIARIRWLRYKHRIPGPPLPARTFSVNQVRERYGVSLWVVYYWIDRGLVTAHRKKPGLPYAITLTDATDHRLRDWVANSPRIAPRPQTRVEQGAL